jgi:hypothetical protein
VINFKEWTQSEAKAYPDLYAQVLAKVRPERQQNNNRRLRELWWRFKRPTPELYAAISRLDRAIVIAQSSTTQKPVFVSTGQVFDQKLVVFASSDPGLLSLLSSNIHYWWTASRGSTLKRDLVYTTTDVFETFPLPEIIAEMRELGDRLDMFRRDLMLSRQAGLTATYNLVHDPKCADADIEELRAIHRAIDGAVTRAYGWTDLLDSGLGHGFHDTRQGTRYTIAPAVKQEILDRLLELNHARYAEEVEAGLHDKKGRKKAVVSSDDTTLF